VASVAKSNQAGSALRVHGEMTIYRAGELAQTILGKLQKKSATARLDLSEVTEIDSAGLQLLLMAHRMATAGGSRLAIVNPSACVAEVLALCNLQHLLATNTGDAA
jgi:anti-anti-sigma factor